MLCCATKEWLTDLEHTMNLGWPQRTVCNLTISILLVLVGSASHAQAVYRSVTPDGKVIYTDQPAAELKPAPRVPAGRSAAVNPGDTNALPFELRQAVSRFPVTLYTSDNCEPCTAGRQLLQARGIPFQERTIQSPEDAQALKRLSGASSLPLLTIGKQQLKGFSSQEWTQYLDAAAYPASSQLPKNYRSPEPSPLAPASSTLPSASAATGQPSPAFNMPPPASPQPVTADNPAGIRF